MVTSLLERLLSIGVAVITVAALMVTFGVSTTAVATMLGGAGIGIGFGTQQVSQNFLSGLMLYFNRPFSVGDWIQLPIWSGLETSRLQGTVERIGWHHTGIVKAAGGDFAFNCTTLYPAPDLDSNHPIRSLTAN
jgi:MscS family membrane protein